MDVPSSRQILSLAFPMAGEHFLVFGLLIFDNYLVGHLGLLELSAQAVVTHWVLFTSVLYSITGTAGSILVAQAVGRGRLNSANKIIVSALLLAFTSGALATVVVFLFTSFLFELMAVEMAVTEIGVPYFRMLSISFPFNFLLLTAAGCLRGSGDARTPVMIIGVSNLFHILLAFLLVFGIGNYPGVGLVGIGWATVISRSLGALSILLLLIKGINHLQLGWFGLDLNEFRGIIFLGGAVGGEQLALRVGQIVNLRLVAELGTLALATYVIVLNTLSLILLIGMGFMNTAMTLVGQQIGSGKVNTVYSTGWRTLFHAWIVMGSVVVVFYLFPGVADLFTNDADVLALVPLSLGILLLGVPFEAVNQVLTGGIRGAGDTQFPMIITIIGHWLIRLPLILVFIGPLKVGLNGIWLAMVIEMFSRSILYVFRFRKAFGASSYR